MKSALIIAVALATFVTQAVEVCTGEEQLRVEHSKPTPRVGPGLGTKSYEPTPAEKQATQDWKPDELSSGSPAIGALKGPTGRRVTWFGIIREINEETSKNKTKLLIEMKYFDGLTDLHLQVVSIFGAGDFRAEVPGTGHKLKKLMLVRAYGKIIGEEQGVPLLAATYLRAWDWNLFTFMDYGTDHSNPEWVKLRRIPLETVYTSKPGPRYYQALLGNR